MIKDVTQVSREGLLKLAEERIFSLGLRDLASVLSYENMRYALGRMIYALEDDNVYCVLAPDATITRNKARWLSGYGYGGVIHWPNENVAFPEIRPNACGMLLMRLDNLPSKKDLVKRASEVEEKELELNGVKIDPDFGRGNHFFELYKPLEISEEVSDILPSDAFYAVLHGSAPELKDKMYSWPEKGEKVNTPLGYTTILKDSAAKEYYKNWEKLREFSKRRRELLAREVVGEHEVISNFIHQGLFAPNEARLGCYNTAEQDGNSLFPVALRWDFPTHILRGKRNLSDEVIHRLEFQERAERLGLEEELRNVNILPHGGGYKIQLPYQKIDITTTSFGNVFTLSGLKPASTMSEISKGKAISEFGGMAITDPHSLPYTYRGESVIGKTIDLGLGDLVAKLRPVLTVKV